MEEDGLAGFVLGQKIEPGLVAMGMDMGKSIGGGPQPALVGDP
jgi:hypothetical protein